MLQRRKRTLAWSTAHQMICPYCHEKNCGTTLYTGVGTETIRTALCKLNEEAKLVKIESSGHGEPCAICGKACSMVLEGPQQDRPVRIGLNLYHQSCAFEIIRKVDVLHEANCVLQSQVDNADVNLEQARLNYKKQLEDATAKLEFLKSKGLVVGLLKSSDCPDGKLAYHIESGSELCNLYMVNKLVYAEIYAAELEKIIVKLRQELDNFYAAVKTSQVYDSTFWDAEGAIKESRVNADEAKKKFAARIDRNSKTPGFHELVLKLREIAQLAGAETPYKLWLERYKLFDQNLPFDLDFPSS